MKDSSSRPAGFDHAAIAMAVASAAEVSQRAGVNIAVAIVDASGGLAGFLRMPGSFLASAEYAQWKAWTAASFRMSTQEFCVLLDGMDPPVREGLIAHPKVTCLPGGLPIRIDGDVVGAVGVSGGSAEQDEAIARSALGAFGV